MENRMKLYEDLEYVMIKEEEIKEGVKKLGEQLTKDYAGKEPIFICILRGSIIFFSDLIRHIDLPLRIDSMAVSSYGSGTETSGMIKMEKDLRDDVRGEDVVIVEDIVDTGRTLFYLKEDSYWGLERIERDLEQILKLEWEQLKTEHAFSFGQFLQAHGLISFFGEVSSLEPYPL